MKNSTEKLFYFLIPALFTFPLFKESISSLLFILLAVNTLFYCIAAKKYRFGDKNLPVLTLPFWIILGFCLIRYSDAKSLGPVNNALFFLLFPVVFSFIPQEHFTRGKIDFYLRILKNVCLVMTIGYIAGFLMHYNFSDFFVYRYDIPKFRDFVYNEITFFKIHPTYFTSVVFLCTAFSTEKIISQKKYSELIYVLPFILITFMLLVKINIALLFVLLCGMIFFRSGYALRQKIRALSLVLLATCVLAVCVPGIKSRFVEMVNSYDRPPSGLAYDSTNIRVSIYRCCYFIGSENYLAGVGFQNLGDELKGCFKDNYGSGFYKNDTYLSHNYFLYIFLSSGILGLLLFLVYTWKIATSVIRANIFLFSVCMGNIAAISLTEDFFYRHYGLFFFSLVFFCYYRSSQGPAPGQGFVPNAAP